MSSQMNRNNQPTSDPSEWQPCQAGELRQLGRSLAAKRRSEQLNSAAHMGAWSLLLVAVGVFLGGLAMSDRSPVTFGGITCTECLAEIDNYHAHMTGQQAMPQSQAEQMRQHLADCEWCRPKFEAMYPGVLELNASNSNGIHRLHLAVIGEPHLLMVGLFATSY